MCNTIFETSVLNFSYVSTQVDFYQTVISFQTMSSLDQSAPSLTSAAGWWLHFKRKTLPISLSNLNCPPFIWGHSAGFWYSWGNRKVLCWPKGFSLQYLFYWKPADVLLSLKSCIIEKSSTDMQKCTNASVFFSLLWVISIRFWGLNK